MRFFYFIGILTFQSTLTYSQIKNPDGKIKEIISQCISSAPVETFQ